MSSSSIDFFSDLYALMNNPDFRYFKGHYMKTWSDVETLFMYIVVYDYIAKEYTSRYSAAIDQDRMRTILRYVFSNKAYRSKVIQLFREYQSSQAKIESFSIPDNSLPRLPSYVFNSPQTPTISSSAHPR